MTDGGTEGFGVLLRRLRIAVGTLGRPRARRGRAGLPFPATA
jgi:hypothetical protein